MSLTAHFSKHTNIIGIPYNFGQVCADISTNLATDQQLSMKIRQCMMMAEFISERIMLSLHNNADIYTVEVGCPCFRLLHWFDWLIDRLIDW